MHPLPTCQIVTDNGPVTINLADFDATKHELFVPAPVTDTAVPVSVLTPPAGTPETPPAGAPETPPQPAPAAPAPNAAPITTPPTGAPAPLPETAAVAPAQPEWFISQKNGKFFVVDKDDKKVTTVGFDNEAGAMDAIPGLLAEYQAKQAAATAA